MGVCMYVGLVWSLWGYVGLYGGMYVSPDKIMRFGEPSLWGHVHPVSITRFPLIIFSPGAGLLRNHCFHRLWLRFTRGWFRKDGNLRRETGCRSRMQFNHPVKSLFRGFGALSEGYENVGGELELWVLTENISNRIVRIVRQSCYWGGNQVSWCLGLVAFAGWPRFV